MFAIGFPQRVHPDPPVRDPAIDDPNGQHWVVHSYISFRFTLVSLFVHVFEVLATPLAIVFTLQNRSDVRVGLSWTIAMLARLPFMIPAETMLLYHHPLRGRRASAAIYRWAVAFQTAWCVAGMVWGIFQLVPGRHAAKSGEYRFYIWILCLSAFNLAIVVTSACTLMLHIAMNIPVLTFVGAVRGQRMPIHGRPPQPQVQQVGAIEPAPFVRIDRNDEEETFECETSHEASPTARNSSFELCCICIEPFRDLRPRAPVVTTACNHRFHEACLRKWNETQPSCPICKSRVAWPPMDAC